MAVDFPENLIEFEERFVKEEERRGYLAGCAAQLIRLPDAIPG